MRRALRALAAVAAALALGAPAPAQRARLLDDFRNAAAWTAAASDGVGVASRPSEGGLRLDYDFSKGSGYAFLRRALPLDLPENFEIRFRIRGEGAANALEMKLVDAGGDNVWWHRKPDYVPPGQWTSVRVKRRQIEFAWGPASDKTLHRSAAIEFVVAAGSGGGKGWIAIDDLQIAPLPPPPVVPPRVVASGGDGTPLVLDLGYAREFGGLTLRWAEGAYAADYAVQLSDDRRRWRTVREVRGGNGGTDWLRLEESEARFVRILPGAGRRYRIAGHEVQPLAFGASANAFLMAVAASELRGLYPRGFVGEQNYWTLLATPEGGESGLIDESGAVEAGRGGFSVEPFLLDGDRLVTWADVAAAQTLRDGDLPIPRVEWRGPGWTLAVTGFAEPGRRVARYALRNEGAAVREIALVLAVRPFQVNPPQQFLSTPGGVSPISSLRWEGGALAVNGVPSVFATTSPDAVKLAAFDTGPLPQSIGQAGSAPVTDPTGLASAALVYRFRLAPGETREVALALGAAGGDAALAEEAAARRWRAALGTVVLRGPAPATPTFAAVRTALAHILMTRDGPALRPGSRSYARSWIRDGAMMSTALLRLGHAGAAADFLEWYAPHQYDDGKVPCCVDARGADPVPEHDSDGELIHLVAQIERYSPDRARLERMWPRVLAAAGHIEALRHRTRVAANRAGPSRHFYGLLPPSISHEGYSAKPMHSYWDDFWALAGLKDAAWLAWRLGRAEEARRLQARADEFRADILASLAAAREIHGIDFIPGAADLGDFDATSTTVALFPGGEQARLPRAALAATFERYWREFEARRGGTKAWDAYTPYEWRNVGAFVRLGWRGRAGALAGWFMADRRPAGWNQWAEVVGREPRTPRFLGDMPHGWVASDFINAVLDMVAYERDGALVLAAGVPEAWLADGGIAVERLRTPYGELSYSLGAEGDRGALSYQLAGAAPKGLVLGWGKGIALRGSSGRITFPLR